MANTGTPFEREVCKDLSYWWSGGRRDDLFWRSDTSGGRATSRRKKNKTTAGQCGDIASTHPSTFAMTDVFTIECKKGYNRSGPLDVVDRPKPKKNARGPTEQTVEAWLKQATTAMHNAGSLTYLLIWRKNGRSKVVGYDPKVLKHVNGLKEKLETIRPRVRLVMETGQVIVFVPMTKFFGVLTPDHVRALSRG